MNEASTVSSQESLWRGLEAHREMLLTPLPFNIEYLGATTNRDLNEVAAMHGYDIIDFLEVIAGKTVLDVGGGASALGHQAALCGVDTKFVSVDVPKAYRDDRLWQGKKTGREVIGLGQYLPFANNSFDFVLSTYALPIYANSTEEVDGFINESMRVLKPGGRFSMSPLQVWGKNKLETNEVISAHLLEMLVVLHKNSHYNVTLGQDSLYFHDRYATVAAIDKLVT